MERHFSTGQSPQWAVAPMEGEVSIATECNLFGGHNIYIVFAKSQFKS